MDSSATILELTLNCLYLVLILSMPPIVVASVVGLLVSLIQALTQIQEQTISFAVKLVAVVITIALTVHWLGAELYNYANNIFDTFPLLVK
jgi:type III secretion HrpO family protein